jgi:hypothetical protein
LDQEGRTWRQAEAWRIGQIGRPCLWLMGVRASTHSESLAVWLGLTLESVVALLQAEDLSE